uniref:TGF-beta family profile domain-containing protein n=1 Tax=Panagrolaimus sp. JU765 TaxID=591449 RepID=A0AC34Q2M2_9BILA
MKRIFAEFKDNKFYKNDLIIRSIFPTAGIVNNTETLFFKLESIKKSEIVKAELHFRQHPKKEFIKQFHFKKELTALAFCRSCNTEMKRLEPIESNSKVWTVWDIKDVVSTVVSSNSSDLSAQIYRNNRLLDVDTIIHKNAPFVIVYSFPQKESENDFENEQEIESNRVKRSLDSYYSYNFGAESNTVTYPGNSEGSNLIGAEEFVKNGPMSLKPRKHKHRRRKNNKTRNYLNDPMLGFGRESSDKKEEKDEENLKILLLGKNPSRSNNQKTRRCKKEKFTVNFRDIGWEHVVIQPLTFDAFYCAGSCDFPASLDGNPSNHALIQSLIHTLDIYPSVPRVCCAPDKMDSLTLLFFDESGNVVLKNFPRMIVSSCGCL